MEAQLFFFVMEYNNVDVTTCMQKNNICLNFVFQVFYLQLVSLSLLILQSCLCRTVAIAPEIANALFL